HRIRDAVGDYGPGRAGAGNGGRLVRGDTAVRVRMAAALGRRLGNPAARVVGYNRGRFAGQSTSAKSAAGGCAARTLIRPAASICRNPEKCSPSRQHGAARFTESTKLRTDDLLVQEILSSRSP